MLESGTSRRSGTEVILPTDYTAAETKRELTSARVMVVAAMAYV